MEFGLLASSCSDYRRSLYKRENKYINQNRQIHENLWSPPETIVDFGFYNFLLDTLKRGRESMIPPESNDHCSFDVNPDSLPVPGTDSNDINGGIQAMLFATPIHCDQKVMVFLINKLPRSETNDMPRQVLWTSAMDIAVELMTAIKNKLENNGEKLQAEDYYGTVWDRPVGFSWEGYEVEVDVIGRSRWSEDETWWVLVGLLAGDTECPFTQETLFEKQVLVPTNS
ncbi:hypothetical protein ABW19_dt0203751 [Dactylella cylindrospora]|nr:hypothetical protein ABW19_dt0203751 [Dactylella cylindrospora]